MWEQLAKAGFIQGNFVGGTSEPDTNNNLSPLNAYNNVIVMGRTDTYLVGIGFYASHTLEYCIWTRCPGQRYARA